MLQNKRRNENDKNTENIDELIQADPEKASALWA